jgi:hypothetical protein
MIFVIGSLWFWVAVVVFIIVEAILVEQEWGWWSFVTAAAFVGLLHWKGDLALFSWIAANPLMFAGILAWYVLVGCIWGVAKWTFHVKDSAFEYKETRRKFLQSNGIKDVNLNTRVPEELKIEWDQSSRYGRYRPQASDNKALIMMWMGYWPWSMSWSLLRDPFKWIYNRLAGRLERISEEIYRAAGFEDDYDNKDAYAAKHEADEQRRNENKQNIIHG